MRLIQKELSLLKLYTSIVLKQAKKFKHQINGGVRWSHLFCVEARYIINNANDEYFEIIVSGASPDANDLKSWVAKALDNAYGYINVNVITEW